MEQEFGQCFDGLMQESIRILSHCWKIKLDVMKKCAAI
jgi:hypothetical protein